MLLKNTLIRNGVSIALVGSEDTGKDDGVYEEHGEEVTGRAGRNGK